MKTTSFVFSMQCVLTLILLCAPLGFSAETKQKEKRAPSMGMAEAIDVALHLPSVRVGYSILTDGAKQQQYVAYYDPEHNMTIAFRALNKAKWTTQLLPSKIKWDSHNYITMALDSEGHLHVSGNMHASQLIYFRTKTAGDITTLTQLPMTGKQERRATYPKFLKDLKGNLIYSYRDGGSGRGNNLYNIYDVTKESWQRLLAKPLHDGEGKMNAYHSMPTLGPDNRFHTIWVWRDTPDCATTHHLSYARSSDLINWEAGSGKAIALPMVIGQRELWVDDAPTRSGMINGGQRLLFDSEQRPVVVYHKNDEKGHMQLYIARCEDKKWVRRVLTKWEKPVPFSGGGAMPFIGISVGFSFIEPNLFLVTYRHKDYKRGKIFLDATTLKEVKAPKTLPQAYPQRFPKKLSPSPRMTMQRASDLGDSGEEGISYLLQYETLPSNHDRKHEEPFPAPVMLRVVKMKEAKE